MDELVWQAHMINDLQEARAANYEDILTTNSGDF
jgi:hypothetical protein